MTFSLRKKVKKHPLTFLVVALRRSAASHCHVSQQLCSLTHLKSSMCAFLSPFNQLKKFSGNTNSFRLYCFVASLLPSSAPFLRKFSMSHLEAVEIQRLGLTQVYMPRHETKAIAMYAIFSFKRVSRRFNFVFI